LSLASVRLSARSHKDEPRDKSFEGG
jgi:hypothetical protein